MIGWLKRAVGVLSTSGPINRWSRPWAGYNLPVRQIWGSPLGRGARYRDGEGAETLPPFYACAALICDGLTNADWSIVKRSPSGSGVEKITDTAAAHAIAEWLPSDRWALLWSSLTSGNGIGRLHRDGRQAVERVETVPSDRVAFRWYSTGALSVLLTPIGAGEVEEVSLTEVANFKFRPTAADPRVGIPPCVTTAASVQMLIDIRNMAGSIARNTSRPSTYLKTDRKLDRTRADHIKERWEQAYSGPNFGSVAILEEGLEPGILPTGDISQMALDASLKLPPADCARLFNVPIELITGESSRASATESRRRMISFCLAPIANLVESTLAASLLSAEQRRAGLGVLIDLSGEMLGSGAEFATAVSTLVNAGIISVDEARSKFGLDAYSGAGAAASATLRFPVNALSAENWLNFAPADKRFQSEPDAATKASGQAALRAISHRWTNGHA